MTPPVVRLRMYRDMVRSRMFEEKTIAAFMASKQPHFMFTAEPLPGELNPAIGQEPAAVGMCAHLRDSDALYATHRALHFAVAKGVPLKPLAAELFGSPRGLSKGRGGVYHLLEPKVTFQTTGIVGAGVPQAVGHALAFKKRGRDNVAVAVVGDGGANQGVVHEALNLASIWSLAVIFLVEDNAWAISFPASRSRAIDAISSRAAGYHIPSCLIVDNDPDSISTEAATAVDRARAGSGPTVIEVRTKRIYPHGMSDNQAEYRDQADIGSAKLADPLPIYRAQLLKEGVLTADACMVIYKEAEDEVDAALTYAVGYPQDGSVSALDKVFADVPANE